MLEPDSHAEIRRAFAETLEADRALLDKLRTEVRPLRSSVKRIHSRATTSISLVGTDGGNNRVEFDPFLIQLIRVVDSSNNEYCLEAVTPTTSVRQLSARQFGSNGEPITSLGKMMSQLGVHDLTALSHMIRDTDDGYPKSPSWVQVYRELMEWSILLAIVREKDFGSDTLIVFDGLLRSKVFAKELFRHYLGLLKEAIEHKHSCNRRKIYVVGMAKHSKVLSRYRLAMALEGILNTTFPAYVEVPRQLEEQAYVWSEYARGDDRELENITEVNKFVGGKMFFVKFGKHPTDPIWPVDVFHPQTNEVQAIMGYLLADALDGFPVPLYPLCLQRAHENAALVDFDFDVMQDRVFDGLREILAGEAGVLDRFRFQTSDPSAQRY
jgi:hypothetical protein